MTEQYDIGMREDFDNMTEDLGREVTIYTREEVLTYEGQSGEDSNNKKYGTKEIAFIQPLDETHEMVASGQLNVGDVRFMFKADTIAKEEFIVSPDDGKTAYKILTITRPEGMANDIPVYVKGYGKIIPDR